MSRGVAGRGFALRSQMAIVKEMHMSPSPGRVLARGMLQRQADGRAVNTSPTVEEDHGPGHRHGPVADRRGQRFARLARKSSSSRPSRCRHGWRPSRGARRRCADRLRQRQLRPVALRFPADGGALLLAGIARPSRVEAAQAHRAGLLRPEAETFGLLRHHAGDAAERSGDHASS